MCSTSLKRAYNIIQNKPELPYLQEEIFKSDDDLIDGEDEDGKFKGCPECNTDSYLMDLTSLK